MCQNNSFWLLKCFLFNQVYPSFGEKKSDLKKENKKKFSISEELTSSNYPGWKKQVQKCELKAAAKPNPAQ